MGTAVSFGKVEDVKAAFFRFDKNNDGSIDKSELKMMLAATGKSPSDNEVNELFKKGDIDGDGNIDLQEFIFLMFPAATATLNKLQKSFKSLNEIKAAFRKFDVDGDGHITRLELKNVMPKFSDEEVDQIFSLGDMDKSGGIDYQEFIGLMMPTSTAVIKKLSANFRSVADIKSAFKKFDVDGDGQITRTELKNGMKCSDADIDVVFALGDLDGDGEINIGEFIRVMSPSTSSALGRFRNTFACIEDVVSAFRVIDSNNDGALSKKELAEGMNSFGKEFVAAEIDAVFSLADVNNDGEICYDEFVSMMFPAAATALAKFRKHHQTLKNAKTAFDTYDVDGDGEISYVELVGGMGGEYTANEISAIFAMGDTNQDGKISFLEFSKIMIPACQDTLSKFWKCFRNRAEIESAFRRFDTNKDGAISFQEMKTGLNTCGLNFSEQEVEVCFAVADRDGDG